MTADTRQHILTTRPYKCEVCGCSLWGCKAYPQLAHRIPQRKWCIKKWGRDVIHHEMNLALVCSLECNAKVQLNPESLEAEELAAQILDKQRAQHGVAVAR